MVIQSKNLFPILLTLFLIGGCGGGGSSTTPPPVVTPPPPPTGGITRTGISFAVGPITGFGSVIVNGIRYDTSGALFTKDGLSTTQDDLAVGHNVVVKGMIDDDNTNATATSVDFDDNVEGPVSSVDSDAGIIVVLGQTVILGPNTSIDDSCPATLDDLLNVAAVEVSGSVDADGVITATRIECKSVLGEMEVTGTVSNLDAAALTFQINALVVDYSEAAMDNFAGTIANDDLVEVKGTEIDAGSGALIATRVELKGALFDAAEGDHAEIEGFITSFTSETQFEVNGIPVTTNSSTTFEGGAATDLDLNLKVEVEGEFDASDTLVATKVDIKTSTAIRVTGVLDSAIGNTLVILGITVNTDLLTTRFEDKSDARVDPLRVGDLVTDDYVEIRGQEQPAGQITAMLVERDDLDSRTELRGFVEVDGKNEPNLIVLGVTIVTADGATLYRDSRGGSDVAMSAVDFWAAVQEGSLIDARGTETDITTLAATELELEMD